jgi:hypothetical protein
MNAENDLILFDISLMLLDNKDILKNSSSDVY